MKIDGNHLNPQGIKQGVKGKEAALQSRIRMVAQELNRLEQKEDLSKAEQEKKQELEKELTALQQQLYNVQKEKMEEQQEETEDGLLKEDGKGELVDERI